MSAERIPLDAGLSEAVDRARSGPEVIISDGGADAAVIISMDKYRELQRLRDGEDRRMVEQALQRRERSRPDAVVLDGPDAVAAWFDAL